MVFADADFFLALLKQSDPLKASAEKCLADFRGRLWTSPFVLTELLLISARFRLNPIRLVNDVFDLAQLRGADPSVFRLAANYLEEHGITLFDSLHAALCTLEGESIISSDAVYDRLGIPRIRLGH